MDAHEVGDFPELTFTASMNSGSTGLVRRRSAPRRHHVRSREWNRALPESGDALLVASAHAPNSRRDFRLVGHSFWRAANDSTKHALEGFRAFRDFGDKLNWIHATLLQDWLAI